MPFEEWGTHKLHRLGGQAKQAPIAPWSGLEVKDRKVKDGTLHRLVKMVFDPVSNSSMIYISNRAEITHQFVF